MGFNTQVKKRIRFVNVDTWESRTRDLDEKKLGLKAKAYTKEMLERIPDLPDVMDRASIALQMLAEGKLNLHTEGSKNLELEELKMKNIRNNMIIISLGIVIGLFIVF